MRTSRQAGEVAFDRYYDPTTAQFLSIDPDLAQTGQAYSYTGDDPLNATDPLGLARTSNKQYRTRIKGLERKIQEHVEKIRRNPTSRDVPHWQSEIKGWQNQIDNIKRRLPGGRSAMVGVTQSSELGPRQSQQFVPQSSLGAGATTTITFQLKPPPAPALGLLGILTVTAGGILLLGRSPD